MSSLALIDRDPRSSVRIVALAAAVAVNVAALISLTLPSPPGALLLPALITNISAVMIDPPVVVPPPPLPEPPPLPARPKPVRVAVVTPPPATVTPTVTTVPTQPMPTAEVAPTPAPTSNVVDAPTTPVGGSGNGAMQTLEYGRRQVLAYPLASVRNREQGEVLLRVLVGAGGLPERVEIARSSGYAKLDRAARESVLRWTFRPVLQNGVATPAWGLVPVQFRLDQG